MRAVLLDAPQSFLDERRRLDLDRRDEMWEGELHVAPPADLGHGRTAGLFLAMFGPVASRQGLWLGTEVGVWATGEEPESYRVPDVAVFEPGRSSARGVESGSGTLLVVEVRSPRDESYDKLPFYDRVGVTEFLVVDRPERTLRRWTRRDARLVEVTPTGGADAVSLDTLPGVVVRIAADDLGVAIDAD